MVVIKMSQTSDIVKNGGGAKAAPSGNVVTWQGKKVSDVPTDNKPKKLIETALIERSGLNENSAESFSSSLLNMENMKSAMEPLVTSCFPDKSVEEVAEATHAFAYFFQSIPEVQAIQGLRRDLTGGLPPISAQFAGNENSRDFFEQHYGQYKNILTPADIERIDAKLYKSLHNAHYRLSKSEPQGQSDFASWLGVKNKSEMLAERDKNLLCIFGGTIKSIYRYMSNACYTGRKRASHDNLDDYQDFGVAI